MAGDDLTSGGNLRVWLGVKCPNGMLGNPQKTSNSRNRLGRVKPGPKKVVDTMGWKSQDLYTDSPGLRESETGIADTFEAEFPVITGRTV